MNLHLFLNTNIVALLLLPGLVLPVSATENDDNDPQSEQALSEQPAVKHTEVAHAEAEQSESARTVATPQPPLIESQQQADYEPPLDKGSDSGKTKIEKPHDTESERQIDNTPQPPLIDTPQEPSYGPKLGDDAGAADTQEPTEAASPPVTSPVTSPAPSPTTDTANETEDTEELDEDNASDTTQEQMGAEEKPATESEQEKSDKRRKKWTETYPVSVNADWLQLKSGEWLRGRIIVMQKDVLEFDSDELDDLSIKWKNVKYLKSYEPYSLRFDSKGRVAVTGAIEIIGDKVHVKTDYDDTVYERNDLNTIASGKETEISYWKTKVTFSVNIRKGNTNQTDFTSKISAKRRTTVSRLVLDYLGNFTKVENTETINNHRFNETYDFFLTRDLFWTPLFTEIYRDPFQNIERRLLAGIGIGYSLVNTHLSEWNISIGPAYQETRFVSVQSDKDKFDSTVALILGTTFNTELSSMVDIEGLYNVTLGDEETGGYTHHSLLTIETELTDRLDFDVTGVWDRVRSPVPNEDGNIPNRDDFRIMIGLGYDL